MNRSSWLALSLVLGALAGAASAVFWRRRKPKLWMRWVEPVSRGERVSLVDEEILH